MKAKAAVRNAGIALFVAACMAAMDPAYAVPANPEVVSIVQPDGTTFQAVTLGDEFQGWTETLDGYTVVRNPATGFFEYAVLSLGGELTPSGIQVVADVAARSRAQGQMPPRGLRPPRNAALEQYQDEFLNAARAARTPPALMANPSITGTWAPTPVSGAKKMLVILVGFTDASLSSGAAAYWNNAVFNAAGSSMAKFYQDNSFGTLSVSPVAHTQPGGPAGVVTVSLAQTHPNCGGSCTYAVESAWINSALAAAAPYVNFAALDTSGNGTITVDEAAIYFILAGYEAAAGSLTPSIWAHSWGGPGVSVSGKFVNHWALNGEKYNASTLMQMGVIAHEMGHAMAGLPDLYDISGSNQGLGIFSLMAGGSWGRKAGETGGATPSNLDAWSRLYLGWSNPQFPDDGTTVTFNSALSSPAAPVMLMNSGISTSEYWLVENRPPVGWDAGMYPNLTTWTGGLLIQHIDSNVGTKAANSFNKYVAGSHQGNLAEEPSTAACSMKVVTTPSTATRGCPTILFYSGNSTAFSTASTPNSGYYSGNTSGLGVIGISAPGNTMTATAVTALNSPNYVLSVTKSGNGSGTITSLPGGINCGATCGGLFAIGSAFNLTAAASPGSIFTGWGGACIGSGTCAVTLNSAVLVTAIFSLPDDGFPPGGAIPAGWIQPDGSSASWVVASDAAYAGSFSLKSGAVTNSLKSDIAYTANFPAGNVSFVRKVSSEASYDFLEFYIDGVKQGSWSGEVAWSMVSYPLAAGAHTLLWRYVKDPSVSLGSDAAWIDSVVLPGGTYALTVTGGGTGQGAVAGTAINCTINAGSTGGTCGANYAAGAVVALSATPAGGSAFMGWLGACTGTGTCLVSVNAATSVAATFAPNAVLPRIDVDGVTGYDALTDGLLIFRYLSGLTGAALTNGAIGSGPTPPSSAEVLQHLNNIRPLLDVDGNGQAEALTDGVMLMRYLFGLRGAALISGTVGTGATRTTPGGIETYIQSVMP